MAGKLTGKQRLFIEEYLVDLNATQAARRAGYKGNDQTLRVVGHENLTKPNLRAEIDRRLAERVMGKSEVLFRYDQIARSDLADFVSVENREDGTQDVNIDLAKALKAGKLHLLKKVKKTRKGDVEIELYDKPGALDKLGRFYRLWREATLGLNIDFSKLTDEQVERISHGEDPFDVVFGASAG